LATAHEQLLALKPRLPVDAHSMVDQWSRAITADEPVQALQQKSWEYLKALLQFCDPESPEASHLLRINQVIQAV